LEIQKFKIVIKFPIKIKSRIIFVKNKVSKNGRMDIAIITTVAQIVQYLVAQNVQ